jgi:hypothetical protein
MWNLAEIFADNAHKANLITTVISVIAAVLVVYFTHALSFHKSRTELRIKKLENTYAALSSFKDAGWKLMREQATPSDVQSYTYRKVYDA